MTENIIYDIAIVGCSCAGMTAAVYARRAEKTVAIIDKFGFGGQFAESPKVENFPGVISASGIEIMEKLYNQMMNLDVNAYMDEVVYANYVKGLIKISLASKEHIYAKTLIIATGATHKKLNLEKNKGIGQFYCVTCDGPFFKNQEVLVAGSGNTGAQYALELAKYCKKVTMCDVVDKMCCEQALKTKIEANKKITWVPRAAVKETVVKEKALTAVKLSNGTEVNCAAIFVAIGMEPATKAFKHLGILDNAGYVVANEDCTTNIPGIYAAGDCRQKKIRQAITAMADGAVAALNAIKYLDK